MCGDAGRAMGSPFSSPLHVFVPLMCSCCMGGVEVCIKLWVINRLHTATGLYLYIQGENYCSSSMCL